MIRETKNRRLKAAKLITFIGLGCAMLGSLTGCPKRNGKMNSVTLTSVKDATLYENASRANSFSAQTIELHRVLGDWGEGSTVASGGQGGGGPASNGGATWLHTFFTDKFWSRPGGDFEATSSASIQVEGLRAYEWGSTDQMVADVKMWLNNPSSNHGWLVMEKDNASMVKRFVSEDTRHSLSTYVANRLCTRQLMNTCPRSPKKDYLPSIGEA